jgi:O-antigen/teichoic acid export membrane protein
VFVSVLAGSLSIVLAAPIASGWDRRPASLSGQIADAFGLSLLVLVPAVAAIALIGDEVAAPLLSGFTDEQIDKVIHAFLALSPSILAAQATAIPLVALYALHRHAPIARLALGAAVLQVGLAVAAVASDGIVALAAATSLSSLAFAGGLYVLLYGRGAASEGRRRAWDFLRIGVPAAACFVVPALTGLPDGLALVVGLALFALVVAFVLPDARRLVGQLGGSRR